MLHDGDGWEEIVKLFDLKIFIHSNVDNCIQRLKIRNLCLPGYTADEIQVRCEQVDRVNAMTVLKSQPRADITVQGVVRTQPDLELTKHKSKPSTDALNLMGFTNESNEEFYARIDSNQEQTVDQVDKPPKSQSLIGIGTWEKDMAQRIYQRITKGSGAAHDDLPISVSDDDDPIMTQGDHPYMIGLIGMPGSGKSVSALLLANELEQQGVPCMIMPHDGYHFTMNYLRNLSNAEDFIYRRGAPDTLDPQALYRDLNRIRNGRGTKDVIIKLPAFDHNKADPEPDQHVFDRSQHKVVICEGLYLLHDKDGWSEIANLLDFTIFMNSDLEICVDRVKVRNQCIPGYTAEEIAQRAETVDRKNAETVMMSKARADVVVNSLALKN